MLYLSFSFLSFQLSLSLNNVLISHFIVSGIFLLASLFWSSVEDQQAAAAAALSHHSQTKPIIKGLLQTVVGERSWLSASATLEHYNLAGT